MTAKVRLILNPIANLGRARAAATKLEQIVSAIGGADWITSTHPNHASELARQAAAEGYDTVVAMGGDGTMHEVLNGLMQVPEVQRPKLGMVPLGSGNDFAFACGISAKPEEAIHQVLTGTPRVVDIGLPGHQPHFQVENAAHFAGSDERHTQPDDGLYFGYLQDVRTGFQAASFHSPGWRDIWHTREKTCDNPLSRDHG